MKKLSILLFLVSSGLLGACESTTNQQNTLQEDGKISTSPDSPAESPEKEEGKEKEEKEEEGIKTLTGTFVGIEQGDYFYFQIEISQGEARSFMVLQPDEVYEKVAEDVEQYIGKQVKVYWKTTKENIPEAGGEIEVEKYIKAEFF